MINKVVTVIPSKIKSMQSDQRSKIRVAAYIRVSSLSEEQEESFLSQKQHYETITNEHPEWVMTEIYADQGVSGMLTKKRTGFQDMMKAAKMRQFDTLLVKSISRFARNTVSALQAIRDLHSYGINCIFEKENLDTSTPQTEFLLTVMAAMAQSESISLSGNVRLGLEYRMKRGEWSVAYSTFLGYDRNADGKVVVNEEQARTVREIYKRFLSGKSLDQLCTELSEEGFKTGKGSTAWCKGALRKVLYNCKYSGTVILQQTYTADVLSKQRKKNNGELPQYRVENDIPAIIDKQTWLLTQAELLRRRKLSKGEPAPGPRPRWGKNDFTMLIRCPYCGAFLNRHSAGKTRIWKCPDKAAYSSCRSVIIKETELLEVTLFAAQTLYDKQPNVSHHRVPKLSDSSSETAQLEAAAIYAENRLSDRVADFLQGERPAKYDPSIPKDLIESLTFNDREWTFRFWGRQMITVKRLF